MSEYKNGVNAFGNMSVDKSDYANEVHTGRAVFVDEDKYANDAKYKAKVDQCLAEGFHKVVSSEGGGSSDFSIARITLTNTGATDKAYQYYGAQIVDDEVVCGVSVPSSNEVLIPLYHGRCLIDASHAFNNVSTGTPPSVSGGVSLTNNGFVITGDGTISMEGTGSVA